MKAPPNIVPCFPWGRRVGRMLLAFLAAALPATPVWAATPQVEIKTSAGLIVAELYPDKAPRTVENFLRYVSEGFYSGTLFHRVIPGFMIQGGGYAADFTEKPTRPPIPHAPPNGLSNEPGALAMARTPDPHSAAAQFFINTAHNRFLDHASPTPQGYGYAVFGRVVEGMETVRRIARTPTGRGGPFPADVPRQPVLIESVRILAAPVSSQRKTP